MIHGLSHFCKWYLKSTMLSTKVYIKAVGYGVVAVGYIGRYSRYIISL